MIAVIFIVGIVFMLPVAVRRLHDSGRSGWWMLITLIPYGGIVLIVLLALEPRPWLWRPQWIIGAAPAAH